MVEVGISGAEFKAVPPYPSMQYTLFTGEFGAPLLQVLTGALQDFQGAIVAITHK